MNRPKVFQNIQPARALAAFAVVARHLGVLPFGQCGVDIFFVISGFITSYVAPSEGRDFEEHGWAVGSRLVARLGAASYAIYLLHPYAVGVRYLKALVAASLCFCCASTHAQPRYLAETEGSSRVGVQVKVERFTPSVAQQIKASGFEFVRFGVWVNAMQTVVYQKTVAAAFDAAHSAGLPVLVTVRSTMSLASESDTQTTRNAQLRISAKRLVSVIGKLVTEHGKDVLAVELWNEPELSRYWPTGRVESTFPVYFSAVCGELKPIRASTKVVGFGFATPPTAGSESDKLLKGLLSSQPDCIDAISYHAYGMNVRQIQNVSSYVKAEYGLPVLISEWGISSGAKKGEAGQVDGIRSFLTQRGSMGTALISIYEWQDTATGQNARERNFGLVDAYNAKKPALDSVTGALKQ